jgi:hypothetical protein
MSAEEYHADPCPEPSLSSSIAHALTAQSPRHAFLRHPRLGGLPRKATKPMNRGTLCHALLLGQGRDVVVLEAADYKTKDAQRERDEAVAAGKTPVLADEYGEAGIAVNSIRDQLLNDFGITLDGESELAMFWHELADDGTRVPCRAMLDHWNEARGRGLDLKISRSAHPRACMLHMLEYGYDLQWAAYTSGLGKVFPKLQGRLEFLYLFAEGEPPYCVTPCEPAGTMRQVGESRWRRAINLWARCMRENKWPAYVTDVARLEAPPWALEREMIQDGSNL